MSGTLSREGRKAPQPDLHGRRVALRVVTPSDVDFLYHLFTSSNISYRWRTRGQTPSPEAFQSMLWSGVLCQFIVERATDNEPLGLITAYNADLRNGTAYLAVLMRDRPGAALWGLDSLVLFLDYLFLNWALRKLYAETSELSAWAFASGEGRYYRVEATLPEHEFYGGRYWDYYMLAFWRRDWEALLPQLLPSVRSEGEQLANGDHGTNGELP